jgi:ribosomal protein S18 acetylase RimI-like enzyme
MLRVERVMSVDGRLVEALTRLIPQLLPDGVPPGGDELAEMVAAPGTNLLLAQDDDGEIIGTLTLLVYRVPTGLKARIEDVVVDEVARCRGVGEALTREALQLAADAGAGSIELTARPRREAANRLYRRLGFERRNTNAYVWRPGEAGPA